MPVSETWTLGWIELLFNEQITKPRSNNCIWFWIVVTLQFPKPKLLTSVYYFGVFNDLGNDLDFTLGDTRTTWPRESIGADKSVRVDLRFSDFHWSEIAPEINLVRKVKNSGPVKSQKSENIWSLPKRLVQSGPTIPGPPLVCETLFTYNPFKLWNKWWHINYIDIWYNLYSNYLE